MRKLVGLLAFLAVIALCTTSYADLILQLEDLDRGITIIERDTDLDVNKTNFRLGEWYIYSATGTRGADVTQPVLEFGHVTLVNDDDRDADGSTIRISLYTTGQTFHDLADYINAWNTFFRLNTEAQGSASLEVKIDDYRVYFENYTFSPDDDDFETYEWNGSFSVSDYGGPKDLYADTPGFDMSLILTLHHDESGVETACTRGRFAPVPEPATMLLVGAGLLGIGIYGRRRKK